MTDDTGAFATSNHPFRAQGREASRRTPEPPNPRAYAAELSSSSGSGVGAPLPPLGVGSRRVCTSTLVERRSMFTAEIAEVGHSCTNPPSAGDQSTTWVRANALPEPSIAMIDGARDTHVPQPV